MGWAGPSNPGIWEKIFPNSSEDEIPSFCLKPSPDPCGLSRLSYLSSLSSFGKGFTLSKPLSPGPPTLSGRNHVISKNNYIIPKQKQVIAKQNYTIPKQKHVISKQKHVFKQKHISKQTQKPQWLGVPGAPPSNAHTICC